MLRINVCEVYDPSKAPYVLSNKISAGRHFTINGMSRIVYFLHRRTSETLYLSTIGMRVQ